MNDTEKLIIEFQAAVKEAVQPFYDKYQRTDLLRVWYERLCPQIGQIGTFRCYAFHGGGLRVDMKGKSVDFDFGNHNRIDGFDA